MAETPAVVGPPAAVKTIGLRLCAGPLASDLVGGDLVHQHGGEVSVPVFTVGGAAAGYAVPAVVDAPVETVEPG